MSGLLGLKQALKATNQMLNIEASNLTRTRVYGAKEVRGSLVGRDMIDFGSKGSASGPGLAINGTQSDFTQGSIETTPFTTDLAIKGKGMFILMDVTGKQLYYTRQGNFHFDNSGYLVNPDGLYVASFDPSLGPTAINPSATPLGRNILSALQTNGKLKDTEIQSILAPETLPNIQAELSTLFGNNYVTTSTDGTNTFYEANLGGLERMSVEINPVVSPLGANILNVMKNYELTKQTGDPELKDVDIQAQLAPEPLANIQAELAAMLGNDYVKNFTIGPDTFWVRNLGGVGDQINFSNDGHMVNSTRGLRQGNRIALAIFPNQQGLIGNKFGGTVFKATEATGTSKVGGPGDDGFGHVQSQALEASNSSTSNSMVGLSLLQRNFTSTTAAMKVLLSAADDLISIFR